MENVFCFYCRCYVSIKAMGKELADIVDIVAADTSLSSDLARFILALRIATVKHVKRVAFFKLFTFFLRLPD